MATFVLVHGAWHGGWCWQRVTPLLRAAAHEVYTPTLTGLGERAHLLTPAIGLETHVQDIAHVLEYEDLRDVVLVGHSYGGVVITGVAERLPDRIGQLVYLDAVVPIAAERSLEAVYQRHRPVGWRYLEAQRAAGRGTVLPVPAGVPLFGVRGEADRRWLRAHLTPHPARTFTDRLPGDHAPARHLPHTSIRCPDDATDPALAGAAHIRALSGRIYELGGAVLNDN
jgi:pimeloyl-ACP methyl ester carboxylesterase